MLKFILIISLLALIAILFYSFKSKKPEKGNLSAFYDNGFKINDIDGKAIDLNKFKGKKLLIVNVASKCGFTPQYEDLENLYEQYKGKLNIIGLPCNQFSNQEPGTHAEIKEFCQLNYGVTFTITEKIEVKGENQHPIYKWLTDKSKNGVSSSSVKWNFQKYLLDEQGHLLDYYYSMTTPMSNKILKHLK